MSSSLVEKASEYARIAHEGQLRKNSKEPYFNHCFRVAKRLQENGFSDSLIAAAYLHDTVEDTNVTIKDIKEHFGEQVAKYVASNTENKDDTWIERKKHTIEALKVATLEIKALIISDKLDNLYSFQQQFQLEGESMWSHYTKDAPEQKKYYEGLRDAMWENISTEDCPSYFQEFDDLVCTFF